VRLLEPAIGPDRCRPREPQDWGAAGRRLHQRQGRKGAGKLWADYRHLKATGEFCDALSVDMGIPITDIIQSVTAIGFRRKWPPTFRLGACFANGCAKKRESIPTRCPSIFTNIQTGASSPRSFIQKVSSRTSASMFARPGFRNTSILPQARRQRPSISPQGANCDCGSKAAPANAAVEQRSTVHQTRSLKEVGRRRERAVGPPSQASRESDVVSGHLIIHIAPSRKRC
jgi:hypothetical protein